MSAMLSNRQIQSNREKFVNFKDLTSFRPVSIFFPQTCYLFGMEVGNENPT